MKTRTQHIQWCKERALAYLANGSKQEAFSSMASDIEKHPETSGHIGVMLGMAQMMGDMLETNDQMRDFINGFI